MHALDERSSLLMKAGVCSGLPRVARSALATLILCAAAASFCSGLLGDKEDGDNIANAGEDVVALQGSEPQEWGGGVHDAHVASASQTDTTMNCAAFQGAAR
ncbi:hypothetical protein [Xanthomonas axonopodis]|uniref:hypothetical protein n=1 Tax=Xanthomonas TaxID=338 RepID=UPI003530AE5A